MPLAPEAPPVMMLLMIVKVASLWAAELGPKLFGIHQIYRRLGRTSARAGARARAARSRLKCIAYIAYYECRRRSVPLKGAGLASFIVTSIPS